MFSVNTDYPCMIFCNRDILSQSSSVNRMDNSPCLISSSIDDTNTLYISTKLMLKPFCASVRYILRALAKSQVLNIFTVAILFLGLTLLLAFRELNLWHLVIEFTAVVFKGRFWRPRRNQIVKITKIIIAGKRA